jgi:hypothetical protein
VLAALARHQPSRGSAAPVTPIGCRQHHGRAISRDAIAALDSVAAFVDPASRGTIRADAITAANGKGDMVFGRRRAAGG